MSIISQARLTSFSQRCLSMLTRRHDIRETTAHNYTQNESLHQVGPRPEPKSSTKTYCVMRQVNSSPSYSSSIKSNTPKVLINLSLLIKQTLIEKFSSDCNSISPTATSNLQYWRLPFINSENGKENTDHTRGSTKHKKKNSNRSMPLIGLVGFLKGLTTGDIDEERAKLSDEQKVKKMKPMELLIAKGVLSMCDQNYGKANELFHEALHIAQDEENEEQEMMILNLLAANYFESGDLKKAEQLFLELIKRMILHGLESTDLAILELSLKLASIYSKNQTTHDKATQGFKFVINNLLNDLQEFLSSLDEIDIHEISEERRDELALLGWSYDWFAKHLLTMNDFTGAAEMLQRALQISSKVLGPLHDQTLILLNDVGTTLAMNGAPEEGRTFMKKAVEGAIESQSNELASFYVNLALVNLKLKKLNEAKRYCEYSIELASKNREHHSSYEVIQLSKNCLSEVEKLLEVENQ